MLDQHNHHKIKNIVIVGGGTAGWLSAAYLSKALNATKENNCHITLIESSEIPTVRIGEATIPTIVNTFKFLGISEAEWMARCNATFKLGIKFVNWSGLSENDVFWHPIAQWLFTQKTDTTILHHWLKTKFNGNAESFYSSCFETVSLCEAQKAPKYKDDPEYAWRVEYAYHFDAGQIANFLREKATSQGVKQIIDNVRDVCLDERGFISHVLTEKYGTISGDLFIDCSGFQGLLINQALQEPFVSYSDYLFCDSAITMSIPYEQDDPYNQNHGGINSYTTATALSSGWTWNIPLVTRTSHGYVYSSKFISQAEAEVEFIKHLNGYSHQARYIKMRVGRNRNSWVKNCVSIGLSSGFIEPLESTGIYLIEAALNHLIHNFPNRLFHQKITENYNRIMQKEYEEIRDFIIMHYCLSKREDSPFWQANKHHSAIPDTLQEKLELWREMWPYNTREIVGLSFPDYSYICILAGMGCFPKNSLPLLDYQDSVEQMLLDVKNEAEKLNSTLPVHGDYLKQLSRKSLDNKYFSTTL
ncbi:MAG: tryptophan 7-halogenase [Desmonostoc vinosum HA7617-LM4]|jgi:tryptophan halogenase|nr:tryptophan 7-halogenase [Desmonostoc vinosum HA7617-LM4]